MTKREAVLLVLWLAVGAAAGLAIGMGWQEWRSALLGAVGTLLLISVYEDIADQSGKGLSGLFIALALSVCVVVAGVLVATQQWLSTW